MYFMSHTGTDGVNMQVLGEDPAAGVATSTMQSAASAINAEASGAIAPPAAEAGIIMTQSQPTALAPAPVAAPSFWQLHKKAIIACVIIGAVVAGGAYVYVRRRRAALATAY